MAPDLPMRTISTCEKAIKACSN